MYIQFGPRVIVPEGFFFDSIHKYLMKQAVSSKHTLKLVILFFAFNCKSFKNLFIFSEYFC